MTDYKTTKQFSEALKRRIRKAGKDSGALEEIAEYYKQTSRKRRFKALSTKTVDKDGRKIKPWYKRRDELSANNKTHKEYSYKRSNLTYTGQLIDSIKAKWDSSKNLVILYVTGQHKGYVGKKGKRGKSVPNRKIVEGQKDQGRDLMKPTRKQYKGYIEIWQRLIIRALRSNK